MVPKLGEILLEKNLLTREQLDEALAQCRNSGEFLGKILVDLDVITEKDLLQALSEQFKIPYCFLKDVQIDAGLIDNVPARFVLHYKFMPIRLEGNKLTIAVSNPLDVWPVEDIRLHLGYEVTIVLSTETDIEDAIRRYYSQYTYKIQEILDSKYVIQKKEEAKADSILSRDLHKKYDMSGDVSVVKLVEGLLRKFQEERATDVHIETYSDRLRIRYRVDGLLYDMPIGAQIKKVYPAVVSRFKVIAGLDAAEQRLPQDGQAKIQIASQEVGLRISVLPTLHGEHLVIKLISLPNVKGLENLGFLDYDVSTVSNLLRRPHGLILFTGPKGCGKTTTMFSCLSRINTEDTKIVSIHSHIEYEVPGITQVKIDSDSKNVYDNLLKNFIWHDADIIAVEEIMNLEMLEFCIRLVLTNHLVLATLNAKDSASSIVRLLDLGVEPYLIASSLEAVISQRLVRVICPECKEPDTSYKVRPEALSMMSRVFKGRGCEACKFTGYRSRTAIYEIMLMTDELKDMILNKSSLDIIKNKARDSGMKGLWQEGFKKVELGITTPEEITRVIELKEKE